MVGVPRSGACQLCRKRRVKCDQGRPECGNCQKYGAACPGYDRGLKFVDGKHQIRQKGKRSDRSSTESTEGSAGSSSGGSRIVVVSRKHQSLVTPLARALLPMRGKIMEIMTDNFRPADTPHDIVGLFTWITHDHLGKKAILDGAICSLALHLTGKENKDPQLVAQSRTLYGQCLNELQMTLQHPTEWKSSETLCATILLCYYELFAGTSSPDTWLQHCKGIGSLMKYRGPAAHADGWEAAMLLYFRGILIMSDMFYPDDEPCFLSKPEWKKVMRDKGRHLIHPEDLPTETINVVDGFFEHLADVPEILKWGYRLREANRAGISVDPVKAFMLAQHTAQVHANFTEWLEKEYAQITTPPVEVPSSSPDTSLYPTVLEYAHPWVGSMYLGTWASIIILQEVLTQCGWPVDYEESRRDLVQKILRSVEYVGKGIMGPFRIGYALRIAYEFASAEAQVWIRGLLDGFSKNYAAIDKSMYPSPRLDQNGYA